MSSSSDIYTSGFLGIAFEYVKMYQNNKLAALSFITSDPYHSLMLSTLYNTLVNEKSMVTLEELPAERKTYYWGLVKHLPYSQKSKITICRAIYAIEKVLESPQP